MRIKRLRHIKTLEYGLALSKGYRHCHHHQQHHPLPMEGTRNNQTCQSLCQRLPSPQLPFVPWTDVCPEAMGGGAQGGSERDPMHSAQNVR